MTTRQLAGIVSVLILLCAAPAAAQPKPPQPPPPPNWNPPPPPNVAPPPPPVTLTITTSGNGSGGVVPAPPGLPCGANCWNYPAGTSVVLFPAPGLYSVFTGWGSPCQGAGTGHCTTTVTGNTTVTATFVALQINVTLGGPGVVTSDSGGGLAIGISCPGTCSQNFLTPGTHVRLTATPDGPQATFSRWGGDCSNRGANPNCDLIVNGTINTGAFFVTAPPPPPTNPNLVVRITGSGTVTSRPLGINCPGTCETRQFQVGTRVDLIATPTSTANSSSSFAGWAGCNGGTSNTSGTPTCVVIQPGTGDVVTATFNSTFRLTLSVTGQGSVSDGGGGAACAGVPGQPATTCNSDYAPGTMVTLTATPDAPGVRIGAWSGACASVPAGTRTCRVTMTANQQAGVTFQ